MKNKILLGIVVFLIPIAILSKIYSNNNINKKNDSKPKIVKKKENAITVNVNLEDQQKSINLNLEDYIIGVVAGEMPAEYSFSALQAQAVAARSYVVNYMEENKDYNLTNTTTNQVYLTNQDLEKKWQDNYKKYYDKIKKAVDSTKNKVMKYNGKTIKAFYFAVSNGYTEDVKNVFGGDLPYLKSVESDESNYKNYINKTEFSFSEFCQKLNINNCKKINVTEILKDNSKRVLSLKVNNTFFKGTDFRKLLSLKSTDFEIEINDKIYITTKGYGHGVGMSQYGAQLLSLQGFKYSDILKRYYQNIEITNI